MASYRIQHTTLEDLADQIRSMCGTKLRLTPAEMLQWLQKVKYIPQGWANNAVLSYTFSPSAQAVGSHPQVHFGSASSALQFTVHNITSTFT